MHFDFMHLLHICDMCLFVYKDYITFETTHISAYSSLTISHNHTRFAVQVRSLDSYMELKINCSLYHVQYLDNVNWKGAIHIQ